MDGEIDPETVHALQDDADVDVCVVDIRQPRQFERAHLPESQNVPLPQLTNRVDALPDADRIVTVCPHGKSSIQAARLISSFEGIDGPVQSMAGGLDAYDGPLEAGAPDADGSSDDAAAGTHDAASGSSDAASPHDTATGTHEADSSRPDGPEVPF